MEENVFIKHIDDEKKSLKHILEGRFSKPADIPVYYSELKLSEG